MSDARKIAPKRIMIADDAASARDLVRCILGRSGYEIFEAEDGEEALECARRFQPDLIILDLQMPEARWVQRRVKASFYAIVLRHADTGAERCNFADRTCEIDSSGLFELFGQTD